MSDWTDLIEFDLPELDCKLSTRMEYRTGNTRIEITTGGVIYPYDLDRKHANKMNPYGLFKQIIEHAKQRHAEHADIGKQIVELVQMPVTQWPIGEKE